MALHQRGADLHAAMPPFEQIHELAEAKMRHTARIKQLRAPKSEGGFGLPELAAQVVAERRALERVENELTRQQRLKEDRGDRWQVTAQLKRGVIEWVTAGGIPAGCTLEVVEDDDIAGLLKKGAVMPSNAIGIGCAKLAADAHRVRSAPFPSADVKAQLRQQDRRACRSWQAECRWRSRALPAGRIRDEIAAIDCARHRCARDQLWRDRRWAGLDRVPIR